MYDPHFLASGLKPDRFFLLRALGCDFFSPETNTQIRKRTGGNNFFKMVSFAYLCITPGFCCHADRRCADTHLGAMPASHLFEVALAADGSQLSSKRVSKLSRRYSRLKKKISTMADDPTTGPRASRSVLLVGRDSTHPVAIAARGRKALKVRGATPTALRESPYEVQRIRRMRELPPSWPDAPTCLWLRWCVHPSLPLMAHWPRPLLLPPVLARGSSTSLGEIRTIAMVPPFSLRAVLRAK